MLPASDPRGERIACRFRFRFRVGHVFVLRAGATGEIGFVQACYILLVFMFVLLDHERQAKTTNTLSSHKQRIKPNQSNDFTNEQTNEQQ